MRVALTTRVAAAIGTAAALALSSAAWAQKLPEQLTWTAYDVGSGGYNQAVAIGNALKNKMGITLRVLPGKNDVSRTVPLREGKVPFSANGVGGTYMVQEGMYEFGAKDWGPQPVRSILLNNSDALLTVVAAGDIGVKTMADLKGKRVAWVVGAPSLNQNITALLAFANLTWADVQKVEFGGFGQAMDGIINNQVDAAFTSTISGKAFQIETSPRKIAWPTVPHNDTEGWKRLKAKAPFYVPFMGTEGAGLSKDKPVEGATYPYPVLMTYANVDAGMVYAMTKAMVELFPDYKDAAPGNVGWDIKRQVFDWVVPVHEGAIKYFKEIGVWKPEYDKNNDDLIKRQKVLADAWAAHSKGSHADDAAWMKAWQKARADALTKAGMEPVLTEW
ncbi:MAG TPA: TAXI family TRAP transporter solute-binding subunit [Ferrovibrio sp.]|jgi:TRAP transporter TAXI family solute receptor|uniref:TAXI family TRAP transporter solute-binding subunit n=1 Tax=Ferrovibrio sp. TaxID=1917215 RepID=UPI002B4B8C60|nr:TAXI family TRAP transporter solute-binding subunit [Ferrovibrio sp.]HLT79216.1 TAXI family TRAP transporter solute-binding subunit [Ferrovibrio sp.]